MPAKAHGRTRVERELRLLDQMRSGMISGWFVKRSGNPRARGARVVCVTMDTGGAGYSRAGRSNPASSFTELLEGTAASVLGFS